MYTIIYDPTAANFADPDAKAFERANSIAIDIKANPNNSTIVSNELTIRMIRLLVTRKVIHHSSFVFKFNTDTISVNVHGNLNYRPKGFCDYFDNVLTDLINHRSS